MKKILLFAATLCAGIGFADAAVRSASSVTRTTPRDSVTTRAKSDTVQSQTSARTGATATTARNATARTTARNTVNRTATARSAARTNTTARSATTTARSATTTQSSARSATKTVARSGAVARATTTSAAGTNTFGTGYNTCRDAYFSCMDQFCAKQDDTYRRCVCSSKLTEIKSRERALGQASDQLQDFKNLNIEVIPKTAAEVKAMVNATTGETAASTARDNSSSAQKLAGISAVLTKTKSNSLSTLGTLDIAGDINAIWATTDLASGANIANLTGESLYNAVHSQCADLISERCPSRSTLNMVVAAYGMYIENDCTTLLTALDKKLATAQGTIRSTEREMNDARLENYNAHNSTSINDCIAQVRKDITADTACGTDYVHCLDISGRYLTRDKGEPIYTADFYQLETQISLSGDVLTNPSNRLIVAELNSKRAYAARGLDTCRDLADDVWNEFMRQAIAEIYQGQHERIRTVKNECLDVVNACYDEQSKSLKDFSNVKEQLLRGSRLELSEEMCKEKLQACSMLYSDGSGNALDLLVQAMRNITDQKIGKECRVTLQEFARDMCAVPSNDSLHAYPYGCRVYAPGEQQYATNYQCNQELWNRNNGDSGGDDDTGGNTPGGDDGTSTETGYVCPTSKQYKECKQGYFLAVRKNGIWVANNTLTPGNSCQKCEGDALSLTICGGTETPDEPEVDTSKCGTDYIGSLYQKMVRYAMQTCVRPSEATKSNYVLPTTVMEDVNVVMDSIRVEMATVLAAECKRLNGLWVDTQWIDQEENDSTETTTDQQATNNTKGGDGKHDITGHKLHQKFYSETGANTKWGYCRAPDEDAPDNNNSSTGDSTTTGGDTSGGGTGTGE